MIIYPLTLRERQVVRAFRAAVLVLAVLTTPAALACVGAAYVQGRTVEAIRKAPPVYRFHPGCWTPEAVTPEFLAGKLRRCFTFWMYGPAVPGEGCALDCFDDGDGVLDLRDYARFSNWASEPNPAERITWEQGA